MKLCNIIQSGKYASLE